MNNEEIKKYREYFAKKLKKLLEERGMSQVVLAEKVGITEVSISRYMHGNRTPKITVIIDIANANDVRLWTSLKREKVSNDERSRYYSKRFRNVKGNITS